jgi:hypothetical protein
MPPASAAQNIGVGLQRPCRGKHNFFKAVIRLKREVNDFACGTKSLRWPPAALPEAGVWRRAWWDGARQHFGAQADARDSAKVIDLGA